MATITLKYDARNPISKKTIDYILSLGLFEVKTGVDESLDDLKNNKVYSAKDAKDLINQCLK
jgi:hypothetical protein